MTFLWIPDTKEFNVFRATGSFLYPLKVSDVFPMFSEDIERDQWRDMSKKLSAKFWQ